MEELHSSLSRTLESLKVHLKWITCVTPDDDEFGLDGGPAFLPDGHVVHERVMPVALRRTSDDLPDLLGRHPTSLGECMRFLFTCFFAPVGYAMVMDLILRTEAAVVRESALFIAMHDLAALNNPRVPLDIAVQYNHMDEWISFLNEQGYHSITYLLEHAPGNIPVRRYVFCRGERVVLLHSHTPDLDINTALHACSSSALMVYIRDRSLRVQYPLLTLSGLDVCNEPRLGWDTPESPRTFSNVISFKFLSIGTKPLYVHHFTLMNWAAKYGVGQSMYYPRAL